MHFASKSSSFLGACAGFSSKSLLHTGQPRCATVILRVVRPLIRPSIHSAWYTCLQTSPTQGFAPSSTTWHMPHMSVYVPLMSDRVRYKPGSGISIMSCGCTISPAAQLGSMQGMHSDSPCTPLQPWPHSLTLSQKVYMVRSLLRPGMNCIEAGRYC